MGKIVGLGAGGHAKVMVDLIRESGEHEIVGLLDPDASLHGTEVLGVEVIGADDKLQSLAAEGVNLAFVGVGSIDDTAPRRRLFQLARSEGFKIPPLVHPSANVAQTASLDSGAVVLSGGHVNPDAQLGENALVNTGAVVEHDCTVSDHAHVSPGAVLAGGVHMGEGAHVGLGASVIEGIHIGANATVGAGATVVEDVPRGCLAIGVPATNRKRGDEA